MEDTSEMEDEEEILMESCPYLISFLTEFCGMFIQMFMGCLGSIYTFHMGPFLTSISFGIGRLTCYTIFNEISPVHINPAKSLGFVILGRMHLMRFVIYVIAQYSGSIAGFACVKAMMPSDAPNVCLNHVHPEIVREQALGIEFMVTMILMLTVASVTDPVNQRFMQFLPLKMGLTVFVLVISIEAFTGAGKNPARSLSPALLYNQFHDYYWLFEIGPYFGAVTGALIYRFIFQRHCKRHLHKALAF